MQAAVQIHYPRVMDSKHQRYGVLVGICVLLVSPLRAQDENPLSDPDLQALLKQAQELQKQTNGHKNKPSPDAKKKLAEMLSQAKEEEARQEEQEKREKEQLQTALKKQLDAPGPVAFPDWMPVTPEFKPAGKPTKKLVDEQVKIVQSGTSSLTPEKIAEGWQAAATAANNLNQSFNNLNVNGKVTKILFLSTRTDPRQEVELEASRAPDSKITQVEISSPLPKPDTGSE